MSGNRRTLFLSIPPLIVAAAWIWTARFDGNQPPGDSPPVPSGRGSSAVRTGGGIEVDNEGPPRDWNAEARSHWDKSAHEMPSVEWIRDFTGAWFFDEGPACLEKIRAGQPGPFRDACLRMAIAAWASGEPENALDWLTRFPETTLATLARSEAVRVWALDSPSAAARWIETAQLDPTELQTQKHTLISAWMKVDSAGALRWITQETDPVILAAFREKAAIATRPEDRQKTATALMESSADPWNDPALEVLSLSWILQEPETAENWLRSQGADDAFIHQIKAGLVHPDDLK